MANRTLNTRLRLKYDTAADWVAKNPVLLAGEVGIESDTLLSKVGDGTKAWKQLGYLNANSAKQLENSFAVLATGELGGIELAYNGEKAKELEFDDDDFVGSLDNTDDTKDILLVSLKQTIRDILNGALRFDIAQSLDDTQKTQARSNIGAAIINHDHNGVYQPVGSYVTTNTTQEISGDKTYTGTNTFSNGRFSIRANSANDDSWIQLTSKTNGAFYAFGIRRPYATYGLQLKYHPDVNNQDTSRPGPADGTSDIYYDIYHRGNYTKIPAATTSAAGLMSAADKVKLNSAATTADVDTKISNLVNSAPEALDTLGELATALETHEDAYDALLETVGKKANASDVQDTFKEKGVHFISDSDITVTSGSSSLSEKWVVNGVDGITEPFDGMIIALRMPSRGLSTKGAVLSIDGGNSYNPLVIVENGGISSLYNEYQNQTTILFSFNAVQSFISYLKSGVATTITGCWQTADGDSKHTVNQDKDSEDKEKPILTKTTNSTGSSTGSTRFSQNVTVNHSKGRISATELRENGVSLADKYALKDEVSGGKITRIDEDPDEITDVAVYDRFISYKNTSYVEYEDGTYSNPTTINYIPIGAGENIKFDVDNSSADKVVKISTDLPTVKAKLTPASEVGGGPIKTDDLPNLGYIDISTGTVDSTEISTNGIFSYHKDVERELIDEDGSRHYLHSDFGLFVPIVAGDGIEFVNKENNTVSINATGDDPVYIVGSNADDGMHDVNIVEDGIEFTDTYEDEYSDGSYQYSDRQTKIPIVAGEGIEFIADNENNIVKINSTVEAPTNMFVATTEQEFNSLITIENVGKAISYNKKMYLVVVNNTGPNPPKVGDVITELYFNTNITPDLNSVAGSPISITQEDGTKHPLVYNRSGTQQLFVYRIFSSGATVVYSASTGWNVDHFTLEQPLTVRETEEEETWSHFISKTPFQVVEAVEAGNALKATTQNEFNSLVVEENEGKTISHKGKLYVVSSKKQGGSSINANDTVETLYFNTDIAPNFSNFVLEDGGAGLFVTDTNPATGMVALFMVSEITEESFGVGTPHGYTLGIFNNGELTTVYATEDYDVGNIRASKGWNVDKFELGWPATIQTVLQQEIWGGTLISKTPFNKEIIVKEVGGNALKAATQDEFDSLVVKENEDKTITYNGKLYIIEQESNSTRVEEGTTFDTLYFNTSIEPDFSQIELEGGTATLFSCPRDSMGAVALNYFDLDAAGTGVTAKALILTLNDNAIEVIYATEDFSYDTGGAGIMTGTKGWAVSNYNVGRSVTVDSADQAAACFDYVSTVPFSSKTVAKEIGGGSGGGISGAWTSGAGGTLTLPEAGTYQLKTDFSDGTVEGVTTFSQIVCWDGNLPTESATIMTLVESDLMCYRFSIGATGVINIKVTVYGQYPTEMDWANMNVEYRKIGEA